MADEGSLAESPRSKREAAHLVCAASSSGTASVGIAIYAKDNHGRPANPIRVSRVRVPEGV